MERLIMYVEFLFEHDLCQRSTWNKLRYDIEISGINTTWSKMHETHTLFYIVQEWIKKEAQAMSHNI